MTQASLGQSVVQKPYMYSKTMVCLLQSHIPNPYGC